MTKGMHERGAGQPGAEERGEGDQEGERPGGRDLAEVVVPEHRRQQRQQRDREQQSGEGDAPHGRELAAVDVGRHRHVRQQQGQARGEAGRDGHVGLSSGCPPAQGRCNRRAYRMAAVLQLGATARQAMRSLFIPARW
jgi:hypothetical protein